MHVCGGAWLGAVCIYMFAPFSLNTINPMTVWLIAITVAPIVYHFTKYKKL